MVSKISCILTSCMASHRSAGVFIFSIFTHLDLFQKAWVFPLFPKDGLPSLGSGVLRPGHIVGLHLWHFVCGLGRGGVEKPKNSSDASADPRFFPWKTGALVEVESVGPFLWSTCNLENRDWYVGKRSFTGFWIEMFELRKWVRIGSERGHHQWQATRYSFPTFSGNKKSPAPALGHHLHGLSHLLLSFHQLTGDTRVHGVLGRGEDVSHTPSTVRFALPSVRKMLEKNSSPKTMANFWQQKSSCFYPTSWFMVQPPNFRCDSLGCFVGKKSVWETKIRKAKNVWTLFWFWSFVHLRWKFKEHFPKLKVVEPQSPHLEAPCAGCGVWVDLEIGRTC